MEELLSVSITLFAGLMMTRVFKALKINFPDVTSFLLAGLLVGPYMLGQLGIPGLQFYMARHTFATLSRNLMRFAKSDVDEALNHVGDMSMADVYIKRDFSIINENNRKLIEEVFKDYL